jgi:steroid delta-isomerase-like uncharacterized protein
MSEQNKMLVRRTIKEVWSAGKYAVVDELVARDYLGHSSTQATQTHGAEGYKQFFVAQRLAFPDIQYTVEDAIAEGDKVVVRWIARGTHRGEFQGIPATNKPGTVTGISIFRLANGKIVECWTNLDELGILQQLGIIPAPERVGS